MARKLLLFALVIAALAAPASAAAESYVVLQKQMTLADNQITLVRGYHEACGHSWLVSQEVHWGVITATHAYVKSVRFYYYLPNGGQLKGGRASAFNANGYKTSSLGDMSATYHRLDPPASYAGSWNWTVGKTFYGGQTNGRVVVNVEKHSQWDTYAFGADCHGKLIIIYYM